MLRHGPRSLLVLAIAIVLAATACDTSDEAARREDDVTSPAEPYVLDISAASEGETRIDVTVTTNLPDGALVHVFASRAFRYQQGEQDIHAVNLASQEVTVIGGEFSLTLDLDESVLLVGVGPGEFDVIGIVSDGVTVCAEFRTGEDLDGQQRQPDSAVVEAVGSFGERLENSPGVKVFGSATANPANWLEVETSVPLESPVLDEIVDLQRQAPTVGSLQGFCLS